MQFLEAWRCASRTRSKGRRVGHEEQVDEAGCMSVIFEGAARWTSIRHLTWEKLERRWRWAVLSLAFLFFGLGFVLFDQFLS